MFRSHWCRHGCSQSEYHLVQVCRCFNQCYAHQIGILQEWETDQAWLKRNSPPVRGVST